MSNRNVAVVNLEATLVPAGTMESVTVSTTAVGIAALPAKATHAELQFEGDDVRIRFDGTAPTASVGPLFTDGTRVVWSRRRAEAAQMIRNALTDVTVYVHPLAGP